MDTEKHIEIQKKIQLGKSPSDEGPYYHHAWWESYKGSVKGKFLGVVIGAMIGAMIGGVVATAAVLIPGMAAIGGAGALAVVGAFAAAGVAYAVHEFSDIGKIVGSEAAQHHQQDQRTKTLVKGETAEIKEEIGKLKALITGEQPHSNPENLKAIQEAKEQETNYRKAHYAKIKPEKINTFAFWKVALIGLAVGAVAGALLATGGTASIAGVVLEHIIGAEVVHSLGAAGIFAASVATMGAMGATFGFNRDFFRRTADKTDLWFKGVLNPKSHARVREHQIKAGLDVEEKINGMADIPVATSVFPENAGIDYPRSETHFRDKVLPAAQRALLSFDHTRATPQ